MKLVIGKDLPLLESVETEPAVVHTKSRPQTLLVISVLLDDGTPQRATVRMATTPEKVQLLAAHLAAAATGRPPTRPAR